MDKLLNYLEDDQRPTESSTVTYRLTLPNAFYLTSATITPKTDPWYLTNMTATLTDPTGNVINSSTYVNKWASKDTPAHRPCR